LFKRKRGRKAVLGQENHGKAKPAEQGGGRSTLSESKGGERGEEAFSVTGEHSLYYLSQEGKRRGYAFSGRQGMAWGKGRPYRGSREEKKNGRAFRRGGET